ncbi:MAG: membrane-bound PQQ-dependent dehydrogenase, glucose/quinate/shikimate family [Sphingobium sp.]|uniref:membrane-bound PQQ-dependent dehydrogenase, glucose/quinate/shikimate family n=1 Tax=Sphingobium sp. TaxID=1912891 RepID=UPI000DB51E1F|nr:membrane-bound PQQ-dependent dehydrogenase, glucose/quinate/shikimate family [Sphingobium sp.]PZU08864.1 MAG: membrane-bound PQQ-dependent dehydrogenase, glucose/quinate/shikimate family [Sphingobium sp.]
MRRFLNLCFIVILFLAGLSLLWLGIRLALLGGSPWYGVSGFIMTVTALLGWHRSSLSIPLYWAFLVANLGWALWEVGLDGWALAPRLAMPVVIGLYMLTPFYRHHVGLARPLPGGRVLWPALLLVIAGAVGGAFWADRSPSAASVQWGAGPASPTDGEWLAYGNGRGGSRYSPLAQITPANVGNLERAWTYHTGKLTNGKQGTAFQANPLKVGNRLFLCAGNNDVIALDPETGRQLWRHQPRTDLAGVYGLVCRGVTYYRVPQAHGPCAERIYTATLDARLIALDAATGRVCPSFGQGGQVDLKAGLGTVEKGYYFVTSPPALVRGRLVLGGWVMDGQKIREPSGVIRAFDAVSGKFSWAFDIGRPNQHGLPPDGVFTRGTPNSWAPMSSDDRLGLVYVPTGNATPDYFGGHRTANDDRYSSAVLALDAESGSVRWSFQTTHHDLWDYDVPAQPTLVDLPGGVRGLLQPTKRGEIFFLDRATGKPLLPVEERPVPQGAVPGERLSRTQPYSVAMPSFGGPRPTEEGMWGLTPIDQAMCRIRFRQARFNGDMTPLSTEHPTLTWPGYLGGIDWGGVSVDPRRGLMIVNNNQVANYNRLIPRAVADRQGIKPMNADHMSDVGGPVAQQGVPYAAHIAPFLSPLAIPCQQPPYGRINAVDLKTGKLVWSRLFGTSRDSGPLALPTFVPIPMGVPNIGGSVATASGLTFIGATQEHMFRAYETTTGRLLWKARLPAGGNASPTTYWSNASGRQFVVIAAGGHGAMLSGSGDALIAYALPKR